MESMLVGKDCLQTLFSQHQSESAERQGVVVGRRLPAHPFALRFVTSVVVSFVAVVWSSHATRSPEGWWGRERVA